MCANSRYTFLSLFLSFSLYVDLSTGCAHIGNRVVSRCGPDPKELCTPCEEGTYTKDPLKFDCKQCTTCTGKINYFLWYCTLKVVPSLHVIFDIRLLYYLTRDCTHECLICQLCIGRRSIMICTDMY